MRNSPFIVLGFVTLIALACTAPDTAVAAHLGNPAPVVPVGQCSLTFLSDDDGCLGANQNAQVIFPNTFTDARQSGQGTYKTVGGITAAYPVAFNGAGIIYPVANITPDGSLTPISSLSVSGCSYSSGEVDCTENGADKTISGYLFTDTVLFDNSTTHTFTLTNNTFILGYNMCNGFGQLPMAYFSKGSENVIIKNNKWITDNTCSFSANLFGLSNDPGLTVQSTGTASFSGTSMTYTAGPTPLNGTPGIHTKQYIKYTGQTNHPTLGSPPQIVGTCGANCYTLDTAQSTSSGKTVTTGPQYPSIYGAAGLAEVGTGSFTAQYNAVLNWNTNWAVTSGGSHDIRWNYSVMVGDWFKHVNYAQVQPTPCDGGCTSANATTISNGLQKFNTIIWPSYAAESGTTTVGVFTTTGTANTASPSGYQITNSNLDFSYNILIANQSINNGTSPFNVLKEVTANLVRTTNQVGTASATYTGVATAGGLAVSGVTGTIHIGDYVSTSAYNNTSYLQITGGSGSTWTLNQAVSFGSQTLKNYLYQGVVTSIKVQGNAFDPTGTFNSNSPLFLDPDNPYGSITSNGNWNLLSGAACNTPNVSC